MCVAGETSLQEQAEDGFEAFMAVLHEDRDDMPTEAYEQITSVMRKRHASPPLTDLEAVLHRSVPVQKARQLLFSPDSADMDLYPALLANAPEGSPESHPQAKMQVLGLTMMYLVHGRCWARAKPFIEAGGLLRLVDLVAHPNLYLASQAMQCLLHVTGEEMFPWHDPPAPADGRSVRQGPDGQVWKRMFELSRSPLIPYLLRHQGPDTFPGSGLLALRLLAFLASWLRYHFTKDRVLRLSAGLLTLLRDWGRRQEAGQEERQLAQQLYEDFNRYPPAMAEACAQLGSGSGAEGTRLEDAEEGEELTVVQDLTQVNHVQAGEAEALRQAGNEAYRKGDFALAIHRYSAALDVPVPACELLNEGVRRATLLSNRAAAYLARAAAGGGRPGEADDLGALEGIELGTEQSRARHYEAALLDAQAALNLDPQHIKANFRKAQALYWLARYPAALDAASKAAALAQTPASAGTGAFADEIDTLCGEIQRCMQAPGAQGPCVRADLEAATRQSAKASNRQPAGSLESLLTLASGEKAQQQGKDQRKVIPTKLVEELDTSRQPAEVAVCNLHEMD